MNGFSERVFSVGSHDSIHLTGLEDDYLGEPVIELLVDAGGEDLTVQLDAFHLRELRLAVQRAEKWIKSREAGA